MSCAQICALISAQKIDSKIQWPRWYQKSVYAKALKFPKICLISKFQNVSGAQLALRKIERRSLRLCECTLTYQINVHMLKLTKLDTLNHQ